MADRLRVLFSIGSMGGGGSERQLIGILRHIDRAAFAPMLYLSRGDGELLAEVPDDVPVFSFTGAEARPRPNYPGRLHLMQVRHLADTVCSQGVEVLYSRTYLMATAAYAAARRARVPWVTVAVADPKLVFEDNTERFVRVKRWLLRRAYQNASRVLANSEGVRRGLISYYDLLPEQVITQYNFVDIERLDRLACSSGPELESGRYHVVCAGRLQAQKGHGYLLEAIDELVNRNSRTELMIHILGQGPLEAAFRHGAGSSQHRPGSQVGNPRSAGLDV